MVATTREFVAALVKELVIRTPIPVCEKGTRLRGQIECVRHRKWEGYVIMIALFSLTSSASLPEHSS